MDDEVKYAWRKCRTCTRKFKVRLVRAEPDKVGPCLTGEMVYVGRWRRIDWHCAECQPSLFEVDGGRVVKMTQLFEEGKATAKRRKRTSSNATRDG